MPCDKKILFCSGNGTPASFSTRALPFGSRFLVAILKNEKTLSGTCQWTNLESLNNIYPRPFHSVVWKEKKLTHKNSPPVKIQQSFQNGGIIPAGEGVVFNKFSTGRLRPEFQSLALL